jgi:hypothetical protein
LLSEELDLRRRFTSVANSERLDLIGNFGAPRRQCGKDNALYFLPLRLGAWVFEIFDSAVIYEAGSAKPAFKRLALP